MNILIVAATKMEITDFCNRNPGANILITGVGIPFSTYSLTKELQINKYDLVIQAGIAGSFTKEIQLASVVLVKSEVFASSGINENKQFFTLYEKGLAKSSEISEEGYLINNNALLNSFTYKIVTAATVDSVTDDPFTNCVLSTKFSPDIESMEGAVLHYVCLSENIQFLQLRSISNYVGERNKKNWKLNESIERLNEALQNVYNFLK